jgi:signal transduction histidine kinase
MKFQAIILFFLLGFSIPIMNAQTTELDQLIKKAEKSSGKEKIRVLAEISKCYYTSNPLQGIEIGKKALYISDSLKIQSEKSKIYNNIAVNYFAINQLDTSRFYFDSALIAAIQFKDSLEIGIAYNGIGLFYEKSGNFDSALIVFHKALLINKQIHNEERIGRTLDNLGTIHQHKGEYKSSLTYLLQANNSYEKSGYTKNLPYLYLKIGWVYSETEDYATAEKWYRKGKQLSIESKDFQTAGIAINAIGVMYKKQGKYDEALKNYLEVIPIADKIKNKKLLLAVYGNIGNVYQLKGMYKNSLDFFYKSLQISILLNAAIETATQQVNLGNTYNILKEYQNALINLEKALPVFTNSKSLTKLLSTYEALIVANNGLKRFENSVEYSEKYIQLKDSLYKNELNIALDSLKVKFNTEQTIQENTLLAQKSEIQEKTISMQRIMMFSAIIIAALLIGFALLIFRNRQKIRKANKLLEEQNIEISAKAEELKLKSQKLVELSQFKDSMHSFLVHDLKNPLNKLVSINKKDSLEENLEGIRQASMQMLNIVSNMLDINKYEDRIIKLSIQNISLSKIINEAFLQTRYLAQQKSVIVLIEYNADYLVKVDSEIITRVFVNLFTNAVKFSPTGGKIRVFAELQNNNNLMISIKDEGEGISSDYIHLVFDKYSQGKVRHSGFAFSTGIGLTFCKMAIESHGGNIGVISEPGQGSSFWFTLPFITKFECLPDDLDVFAKNTTSNSKMVFNTEESLYLQPFCNILKSTSIYQISDVKEILNSIEGRSENIMKWKCLIFQALSECNEVKYFEQLNSHYHESN